MDDGTEGHGLIDLDQGMSARWYLDTQSIHGIRRAAGDAAAGAAAGLVARVGMATMAQARGLAAAHQR
jgi:hypothetical protein